MGKDLNITPGPWTWDGPADNIHVTQAETDNRICFLTSHGPTEANANLIAAAPDLHRALSAAQAALKSYEYDNASPELAAAIGAFVDRALAKAEGRS